MTHDDLAQTDRNLDAFLWDPAAQPVPAVELLAARLAPLRVELKPSHVAAAAEMPPSADASPTATAPDTASRNWVWLIGAMAAAAAALLVVGLSRRADVSDGSLVRHEPRPAVHGELSAAPDGVQHPASAIANPDQSVTPAPPTTATALSTARRSAPAVTTTPLASAAPTPTPTKASTKRSAADIRKGIGRYRTQIAQQCWKPRAASKSTRVTLRLTIRPSGTTSNISASGGAGYPGLTACITSNARSWRFAAADESSTVTFPFVFAGKR